MNRRLRIIMALALCLAGSVMCMAQDSLRYENLSCVNPADNNIQESVVFSMKIIEEKKSRQIELVLENYPPYTEPLKIIFGKTTSLGSGKVTWMSTGSASLTRESKGVRWMLLFGAPNPEKSVVPCRLSKITSFGQDIQPFQLAFAPGQVEQIFELLRNAVEKNIIAQSKL